MKTYEAKVSRFLNGCACKMSSKNFDLAALIAEDGIDKNIKTVIRNLGLAESKKINGVTLWKWRGENIVSLDTIAEVIDELRAIRTRPKVLPMLTVEEEAQSSPNEFGALVPAKHQQAQLDRIERQNAEILKQLTLMKSPQIPLIAI